MKHLIFIVAYNHENFITKVLDRLSPDVFLLNYEILIIDDASSDRTFQIANKWSSSNNDINLTILKNPKNLGYGGNQKMGFQYAIEKNFDTLTLLHGDGQYAPEIIYDLIKFHIEKNNGLTLGSRMIIKFDALKGKMPLYKFFGNIILTYIQNKILSSNLSEFHTGYRVYNVNHLNEINFHLNTNEYHFDTEIILQFLLNKFKINEFAIPTYYGEEISYVNGFKYAYNVLKETLKFKLQKLGIFYEKKYDKRINEMYFDKSNFFSTHSFAVNEIAPKSKVIDFGSSHGYYLNKLKEKECYIKTINKEKINKSTVYDENEILDLNNSIPKNIKKFDYLLFLDIIEHLYNPEDFIHKISKQINNKQLIIASTGNIAFILVRIMLLFGFFNYGKRGILDITHTRLFNFNSFKKLFHANNFEIKKIIGIPAPFPLALGNNFFSKFFQKINLFLIKLFPKLFSYQILLVLKPTLSIAQMLKKTIKNSKLKNN